MSSPLSGDKKQDRKALLDELLAKYRDDPELVEILRVHLEKDWPLKSGSPSSSSDYKYTILSGPPSDLEELLDRSPPPSASDYSKLLRSGAPSSSSSSPISYGSGRPYPSSSSGVFFVIIVAIFLLLLLSYGFWRLLSWLCTSYFSG